MSMKPYRYSVEWVSAEENLDEAEIAFGSVWDWIERGGGLVQVGAVEEMPSDDVAPDSPLARALSAPRAER